MLEILTFSLRPDADMEGFIAADARVQAEFAYQQPGIVRRTTSRGEGGRWAVVTVWGDGAAADAAAAAAGTDPAVAAFDAFVDAGTTRRECFEPLPG